MLGLNLMQMSPQRLASPFLDPDINNLFHPEEWVGYEDVENNFVLAQVIHLVVEGSSGSLDVRAHIHEIQDLCE